MGDPRTTPSTLTVLSQQTGVQEYRLAMFATLLSLPLVSALIATLV
jgi:hypothetical protein